MCYCFLAICLPARHKSCTPNATLAPDRAASSEEMNGTRAIITYVTFTPEGQDEDSNNTKYTTTNINEEQIYYNESFNFVSTTVIPRVSTEMEIFSVTTDDSSNSHLTTPIFYEPDEDKGDDTLTYKVEGSDPDASLLSNITATNHALSVDRKRQVVLPCPPYNTASEVRIN